MMSQEMQDLRSNRFCIFEGVRLEAEDGPLRIGDTYLAERNSGPKLLTVKQVHGHWDGLYLVPTYVESVENEYPYDYHECVKVKICI